MPRSSSTSHPKVLFSSYDTRPDLQQAARGLHELGLLGAFYTTVGFAQDGGLLHAARYIDRICSRRTAAQLQRRTITEFPSTFIKRWPWWEVPRTILSRANADRRLVDAIFHHSIVEFDRHVARHVDRYEAVYAGNNAAKETFRKAKKKGLACIYSVRSLHPQFDAAIRQRELNNFPDLHAARDPSRDRHQHALGIRRQAEWNMADAIVMHSAACRDSYDGYGLDLDKVFIVPLGFPEVGPPKAFVESATRTPLRVLWAGTFSIRKGAHHFIRSLDLIPDSIALEIKIFGKEDLPRKAQQATTRPIRFAPTIPHAELFEEYRRADVLVLPTLSDAYAMVTTEAMSQGLPVITTTQNGASEMIRSGENGIVIEAGDAEALARALCWCAENRAALHAIGERARHTAASWQWHHYRNIVGDLVANTIQKRPRNKCGGVTAL